MKGTEQKIFDAADRNGITVKSYTITERDFCVDCNKDIIVFFRVVMPTNSTVEEIENKMNEMFYRAKGTSHSR